MCERVRRVDVCLKLEVSGSVARQPATYGARSLLFLTTGAGLASLAMSVVATQPRAAVSIYHRAAQ